jgi:3-hydroxymyristoyl/3-hydroxydecanoyl-(acyl carrier protein) dehydratase
MSIHRFSAFSFIDSITSIDSTGKIKGYFRIPAHLKFFPQSLVAEAIGQLAAWFAMSTLEFTKRPVAALARETVYHSEARPGEKLTLVATIESCDNDLVSYSGKAIAGDRLVLELKDCSGVMLPQEEFDDYKNVCDHFNLLKTIGAKENRLAKAPCILATNIYSDETGRLEASLIIPKRANFLADHFPNKPVFPATLLIYALERMVIDQTNCTASQPENPKVSISAIRRVKVRSWITPGAQVRLKAETISTENYTKLVKLTANLGDKLVASALLDLLVAESEEP